jgi:hypothetical protein
MSIFSATASTIFSYAGVGTFAEKKRIMDELSFRDIDYRKL